MIYFKAEIELNKFPIKKNGKEIFMNRSTGRRFIASNSKAQFLMNQLNAQLLKEKLKQRIDTIDFDINVAMRFIYPKSVYYTKKGTRSNKVADISNLYQSVEDGLQKAGIIRNDSLICSHDGSGREAGEDKYILRIIITKPDLIQSNNFFDKVFKKKET